MGAFWMVYVNGRSASTFKHPTKAEAMNEAARLFKLERQRVYVLEAVGFHDIVQSGYQHIDDEVESDPVLTSDELALASKRDSFIPAIKSVRERLGCGLKEAKDIVEEARKRHGYE